MTPQEPYLEAAGTAIRQANLLNSANLEGLIQSLVINAKGKVKPSQEALVAEAHLQSCVQHLAQSLLDLKTKAKVTDEARGQAKQALELLRSEYAKCEPSAMASILHL